MRDTKEESQKRRPYINLRPFLFLALGVLLGICLYGSIRFGEIKASTFVVFALLFFTALYPLSLKRTGILISLLLVGASLGVLSLHIYDRAYFSKPVAFESYSLSGTVVSVSKSTGYSVLLLKDVTLNGEARGGKMSLTVNAVEYLPGDEIEAQANVESVSRENFFSDGYKREMYAKNVRCLGEAEIAVKTGESKSPFLRLNAALYERLYSVMGKEEASVSYALLTGNSSSMDEEMIESIRRGGIAHIFAISGLHIGILYSFSLFLFKKTGKWRILPAALLSTLYCAFCSFTVSSVRALIMCSVFSLFRILGQKSDFLEGLSFAAVLVLLLMPAQWYSAGFRLSFGACLGLALFQGTFERFFKKIKLIGFLSSYLSANLSVLLLLFPIQMDCFGYFSFYALFLNILFVPILPVLFLGLMIFSLCAILFPAAAPVFLALPEGGVSLFLFVLAEVDPKAALSGFSLGAGSALFLLACIFLSERVRMQRSIRALSAVLFSGLFTFIVILENVVFSGFTAEYFVRGNASAALIKTNDYSVLFLDEDSSPSLLREITLKKSSSFDLAVTLGEGLSSVNRVAFSNTDCILAPEELESGLQNVKIVYAEEYVLGDMQIRYLEKDRVLVFLEGQMIEICFHSTSSFSPDIFLGSGDKNESYTYANFAFWEREGKRK